MSMTIVYSMYANTYTDQFDSLSYQFTDRTDTKLLVRLQQMVFGLYIC